MHIIAPPRARAPTASVQVLRLMKLVRLIRSTRLYERYRSKVKLSYSAQTVIKCVFITAFGAHWCASLSLSHTHTHSLFLRTFSFTPAQISTVIVWANRVPFVDLAASMPVRIGMRASLLFKRRCTPPSTRLGWAINCTVYAASLICTKTNAA